MAKLKTEVTDAPPVEEVTAQYLSPQTLLEQKTGREVAQANALKVAAAEARRIEEEAQKKTDDEEKAAATREAKRLNVFPHAGDQEVKP